MGLLDNTTQRSYYQGNNQGNYQFTSLEDIINQFMFIYVGEDKIIPKVNRTDVQFHAMRAIQELSYDVFKSVKSQEIEVPNTLKMPIPQDYVNYVKLVRVGSDGVERVLYPTGKTSNPFAISQDTDGNYKYTGSTYLDEQGEPIPLGGNITTPNTGSEGFDSETLSRYHSDTTVDTYTNDTTDIEIDNRGRRYG